MFSGRIVVQIRVGRGLKKKTCRTPRGLEWATTGERKKREKNMFLLVHVPNIYLHTEDNHLACSIWSI